MKSGKHVLLLTPGFAADEADDSCIPALQVYLKTFHELFPNYKLSLIAFHYPFSNSPYQWNGIDVFPCNGRNKKWLSRLKTLRTAKTLSFAIHQKQKVDLIHSFWLGECAEVGEELSNKWNVPHLNTLMGQDVRESNRYLKKHKLNSIPTIALSERHAFGFEKNTRRNVRAIIPWGIESNELKLNTERSIDIFAAGSLIELKHYDWLIRAVAKLKSNFPAIRVTLAGDGPMKESLERLATSLGVLENIRFAGQISRKDVLELMSKSKLFFHPSEFESYGFVFAEARKCGLAIVSSPVGIAKDSVNWKVCENLDGMVEAMNYFLVNKRKFEGEIIYSAKTTAERYEELYREMMGD